jgi:pyrophosphatase PpaX
MPQHAPRPIAVLFDLDGTLIDSIGLLLESVRHAFQGFTGPVPTDADWIAGIGTPLAAQIAEYARTPDEVETLTVRYRTFQREHHDQNTSVYPGTLEVVQALQAAGHPMGIVTSKGNAMMDRALSFTGLAQYMGSTIGCDSCDLHKPDPFPVHLALQELGYSPHEAVFVGDSPHDMNAGNAANVKTIAALWGPFTRDQLVSTSPTYFLDRISDLPQLIDRIQNTPPV